MEYINNLLIKYKNKGSIIDTNLLLLYFVGKFNIEWIGKFKRVNKFSIDDFLFVTNFFNYFNKIVTTPHILTEVSNLSKDLPENILSTYFEFIKSEIQILNEQYEESRIVCSQTYFNKLGLTDSGIVKLSNSKEYLIITEDFPLSNRLSSLGVDVININHIRSAEWFQ